MANAFTNILSRALAGPLAGTFLLLGATMATQAHAGPQPHLRAQPAREAGLAVTVDHRRGPDRRWDGRHGHHRYELGPRQIRRSLRHRGFYRIEILDRRGPMYIVKAHGWRGFPVRLVVDSRNADIVRSRPLGPRFDRHLRW